VEHELVRTPWRRGRGAPGSTSRDRGIVSATEWRQRRIRWPILIVFGLTFVFLLIVGLGPVLWMLKASVTPTQDTLRFPMALWPHGFDLGQLAVAWNRTHIDRYLWNTVVIAIGSWAVQLLVATTGGFALSILRPRFGGLLSGLVIATLFLPPIVLLVPLYLTIVDVPIIHARLIDNYWAIWLPAGASAVNVILMKRFFDNLPREILDAARVDGAGPLRLFRSVVLPMSGPILGVVSVFAVIATWKDYLWPLLVIRNPNLQPLSVRLPTLQPTTDLGTFIAALTLASIFPVVLFLVFQRLFLGGQGLSGAIKG
jgi:multiple sugar transport system permease protein